MQNDLIDNKLDNIIRFHHFYSKIQPTNYDDINNSTVQKF